MTTELGSQERPGDMGTPQENDGTARARELAALLHAGQLSARDSDSALLTRCSAVARDGAQSAQNPHEANVFRLASMLVRPQFPAESACLMQASERYFALHADERLDSAEVVRKGWVLSLPRLQDLLTRQLCRR